MPEYDYYVNINMTPQEVEAKEKEGWEQFDPQDMIIGQELEKELPVPHSKFFFRKLKVRI